MSSEIKRFKSINEFEIISKTNFGEGSFATVKIAKKKDNGKKYALKIIDITKADSSDLYIIEREIYTHSLMKHKNIIKFKGFIQEKKRIILVMEFAENGDLFSLLSTRPCSKEEIRNFFKQVVQAFYHIHSKNVIHRDLKPENILLDKDNNLKICDFGWSAESFEESKRMTFCGTYEYMAPEVLTNQKQTSKTDIWSLGVLLYEMTHLKAPFEGRTANEVKNQILKNKLKFKKDADKSLIYLILKLLKVNPKERLSCEEILKQDYLKDDEILPLKNIETNKIKSIGKEFVRGKSNITFNFDKLKENN